MRIYNIFKSMLRYDNQYNKPIVNLIAFVKSNVNLKEDTIEKDFFDFYMKHIRKYNAIPSMAELELEIAKSYITSEKMINLTLFTHNIRMKGYVISDEDAFIKEVNQYIFGQIQMPSFLSEGIDG